MHKKIQMDIKSGVLQKPNGLRQYKRWDKPQTKNIKKVKKILIKKTSFIPANKKKY